MHLNGIHIKEWGVGNTKVALLIHGLASSSMTWHQLGKDLASQGYHVLAPDLSGHGKSVRNLQYSVEEWVKDLLLICDKPDLLLGHSIGGVIAAQLQAKVKAKKLILVDPVYHLPTQKILLKGIQTAFSRTMVNKKTFRSSKNATKLWHYNDVRAEIIGLSKWDSKTSQALQPYKNYIINCLLGSSDVMLMRAKGSYILPASVTRRKFNDNVWVKHFNDSGHNIHCESYSNFWEDIKNFIAHERELINA